MFGLGTGALSAPSNHLDKPPIGPKLALVDSDRHHLSKVPFHSVGCPLAVPLLPVAASSWSHRNNKVAREAWSLKRALPFRLIGE